MNNITIGADPEMFFIQDGLYPARYVFNAHGIPDPFQTLGGSMIVDGVALELQPSAGELQDLVENTRSLLSTANAIFDNEFVLEPVAEFDTAYAKKDKEAAVFGCDPDKSAWGAGCKPGTIDAATHPWRYAGGHIHIGHPTFFSEPNVRLTCKKLDRTVGLAIQALGNNKDWRRRLVYGRPGIYRLQPWGMEYRTPSIYAFKSPEILEFTIHLVQTSLDMNLDELEEVIPNKLLVNTMRSDSDDAADLARELYATVATFYGLPELPDLPENWKEGWL